MRQTFIVIVAVLSLLLGMSAMALATEGEDHKTTICHRTASDSNPYVLIEVDDASLDAHYNNLPGHPAKEWKTAGEWDGKTHAAGDPKEDYEAYYDEKTETYSCSEVQTEPEVVTPLVPTVTAPTCEADGTLVLPVIDGVVYTVEPVYTAGATGTFAVTATADDGYVLAEGDWEWSLTVLAKLTGAVCDTATPTPTPTPSLGIGGPSSPPASVAPLPTTSMTLPSSGSTPAMLLTILFVSGLAMAGYSIYRRER